MAEKSVEQARKAFDTFMSASQKAASTIEGHAVAATSGAKDLREKAMSFAEKNVESSFEFAQKLVRAKDPQEFMRLQSEFVQSQMQAMTQQARELGQVAGKAGSDAVKPKT